MGTGTGEVGTGTGEVGTGEVGTGEVGTGTGAVVVSCGGGGTAPYFATGRCGGDSSGVLGPFTKEISNLLAIRVADLPSADIFADLVIMINHRSPRCNRQFYHQWQLFSKHGLDNLYQYLN